MRSKGFSLVELLVALGVSSLLMVGMAAAFANVERLYVKGIRGTPLAIARQGLEGARAQLNASGCVVAPALAAGAAGASSDRVVVASGDVDDRCNGENLDYFAVCLANDGTLMTRRAKATGMPPALDSCANTAGWSPLFPDKLWVGHVRGTEPIFTRSADRNRVDLDAVVGWRLETGATETWKATFVIEGGLR